MKSLPSATVCPKCGLPIVDDDVVLLKSPIEVIDHPGEKRELFQHTPEKDKPKNQRRRHCGEWLLR